MSEKEEDFMKIWTNIHPSRFASDGFSGGGHDVQKLIVGVAGKTLNDSFGAYFRVLIPKNENIPWDVPGRVALVAMCRCLMEHSSALCTLLWD